MVIFLEKIQKVQAPLHYMMTVLKSLGPNKDPKPVEMIRKYIDALELMANVQEILMLMWTISESLVNAIKFPHSLAEIPNVLVHLKTFSDNLRLGGSMTQAQVQRKWASEILGQMEVVAVFSEKMFLALKFLFQIQKVP